MNKMFAVFLLGAILLFGCTGVGQSLVSPGQGGEAVPSAPDMAKPGAYTGDSGAKMVVKTGTVGVRVPQGTLEDKYAKLKLLAIDNGGEITGIAYNEYSTQTGYSITLKLDPAKFDGVLSEIKKLGEVKSVDTNLEDVTTQYRDLNVRTTNLREELDALNALYNKTGEIDDILKIRGEIGNVETQLELYEMEKLDLERRASKSTIMVYMYEEKPALEKNLLVPLGDLAEVFFGAMGFAITAIVGILGFLLPGIVLGAIAYGAWNLVRKKK